MILRCAAMAAAIGVVFLAGCSAGPQRSGREAGGAAGPVSLSDLPWLTAAGPSVASSEAPSPPAGAPQIPEERGRVTAPATPRLEPLPEAGIWRPQDPAATKPRLPSGAQVVTVRRLPPLSGVNEILEGEAAPATTP